MLLKPEEKMKNKKLYLVHRPSLKDTTLPAFYYTFAKDEKEAIWKVEMKWGEYDPKSIARELTSTQLEKLVIATNYFG